MLIVALLATAAGIAGSLALMWGWFAIGGALLLTSVLVLRWPGSIWDSAPAPALSPRARRLALLGVCALAVFFRVYHLNQPGLWGDDAINGLLAFKILDGKIYSPFQIVAHSHSNFHALSNYPIAAAFWLFGADLTTLRLPGIVLGSLCVPLLYATVAPLFGSAVALLTALFYASSPPQIIHAKELVQIITGQFFQLAGLCLLVRGVTARRWWLIAAAGLPLAACTYTYHSARLAPLVAIVYAVHSIISSRRSSSDASATTSDQRPATRTRAPIGALLLALLVFALALIPAIRGYVRQPEALVQRVGATSIWPLLREQHSLWPLWDTIWRTLMMFHYQQGPEYYWFGIATDPAVNAVIGFLFVHGLVESLARWRESRHFLLLTWLAVGLAPALLSTGAPRLYRAFLATPPIYVWAAMPVVRLLTVRARGWSRAALRAVAVALVAAVPLIDFNYYFYRVYTHPAFRWFQGERMVDMARTLRDFGPGWTGYLLSDNFDVDHETFRFLTRAWGLQLRGVSSLADVLPLPEQPEGGALFILSEANRGAAAAIARMYPGHEVIERRDPTPRGWWFDAWLPLATRRDDELRAAFYAVPGAEAQHPHLDPPWGLEAQFELAGRRVARREPYPLYAFLPATFPERFNALMRAQLSVPEPGGYHLDVDTNADWMTWIDGHALRPNDTLPAGEHAFALRLGNVDGPLRLALFWYRPGEPRVMIPPEAFAPPSPTPRAGEAP